MEKKMLAPKEVAEATINTAKNKAQLATMQSFFLALLAGLFIGLGSNGFLTANRILGGLDPGIAKLIGAGIFPVGLMLVLIAGAELFTGNNLMVMGILDNEISIQGLLKNWSIVYVGNFIGSVALAYAVYKAGFYNEETIKNLAISVGEAKISLTFLELIIRGTLCNIVVVLTVWLAAAAKDIAGKILAIWFPIMLFVLLGFEHSVANMFFLPLAKFIGLNASWLDIWTKNLIPVTIGNIIGGGFIISGIYYLIYIYPYRKKK